MAYQKVTMSRETNMDSLQVYYGEEAQQNDASWPQVPSDPSLPWPSSGSTILTSPVNEQNFINIPLVASRIILLSDWDNVKSMIKNLIIKTFGLQNPIYLYNSDASLVDTSNPLFGYNLSYPSTNPQLIAKGTVLGYIGLETNNPANAKYLPGSSLERQTFYQLLSSDTVDRRIAYHWEHEVSSGVTETFQHTFGTTVGFEISFTEGGFPLPAKAEQKITASLSYTFGYSNAVTSGEITKQTFDFRVPGPNYQYQVYKCGVYQLNSKYKFKPGAPLLALADTLNNGFNEVAGLFIPSELPAVVVEFSIEYTYLEKSLYATQTPDPTPNQDNEHPIQYKMYNDLFQSLVPPVHCSLGCSCLCPSLTPLNSDIMLNDIVIDSN
ncbi:hypothetical protein ACQKIW_30965 [Bacillus thuringiensis]|uniref:hypothetical protein n=1 Tax=Bacillus thuringiensis TaxID=1428 RepID=UPI002B44F312